MKKIEDEKNQLFIERFYNDFGCECSLLDGYFLDSIFTNKKAINNFEVMSLGRNFQAKLFPEG